MRKRAGQKKGVFCLEADWWGVRDKTSMEPVLRLLHTLRDCETPYLHHDVGTREEFDFYLRKWTASSFASHPILYLGFHGEPGSILVGDGPSVQLGLAELARQLEGRCRGRVIHFGSCDTLDVHGRELNRFLEHTGALAVFGFKDEVDFLESASFELLLLGYLQQVSFTRTGMRRLQRLLAENAPGLRDKLRFRIWPEA